MKLAITTEMGFEGKIAPKYKELSILIGMIKALNAYHIPLNKIFEHPEIASNFDYIMVIIPKRVPEYSNVVPILKEYAKVIVHLEGPVNLFQDWSPDIQIAYIEALKSSDVVCYQGEYEKEYWKSLLGKRLVKSPMGVDTKLIKELARGIKKKEEIYISGNHASWYNGINYLFIEDIKETVVFPSMGRKQPMEERLPIKYLKSFRYLPFLNWSSWVKEVAKAKKAIYLPPVLGAASTPLTCATLGIPTIVNKECSKAKDIFPSLSIEWWNMNELNNKYKLLEDKDFYDEVSEYAKKKSKEYDVYKLCKEFKRGLR